MRFTKAKALSLYLGLNRNTEEFRKQIIVQGFNEIDQGSYKSIYSKNKLGYVIKIARSLNDEFAKLPSKLKNFYIKPYYIDERIVIQQKADTTNSEEARQDIADLIGQDSCCDYDIWEGNCGCLNGKPVVFDFAEV
jgi:fructosamine-3-kinase